MSRIKPGPGRYRELVNPTVIGYYLSFKTNSHSATAYDTLRNTTTGMRTIKGLTRALNDSGRYSYKVRCDMTYHRKALI